jgi:hypothetical protein
MVGRYFGLRDRGRLSSRVAPEKTLEKQRSTDGRRENLTGVASSRKSQKNQGSEGFLCVEAIAILRKTWKECTSELRCA